MSQIYFFEKNTYIENTKPWIEIIKRGESGSLVDYSYTEQIKLTEEFLSDYQTLAKHFSGKDVVSFVTCDLNSFLNADRRTITSFLRSSCASDHPTVFFMLHADRLLDEKIEWLSLFNTYIKENNPISMLFFFNRNITAPFYKEILTHLSAFSQNIVIKKSYTEKDNNDYMVELEEEFETTLSVQLRESILTQCAYARDLMRVAVQYFSVTHTEEHIFDHPEMILTIQARLSKLEPREYEVLQKTARQDFIFSGEQKEIIEYLVQTKVVDKIGERFLITTPLIYEYIINQDKEQIQIYLDEFQNVFVNKVNVNDIFSKTELVLVRFLLRHQGTLIARQELANVIWQGSSFNDSTLDQIVKRFREKLATLGLPKDLLQTKKNQGFIFSCNV